LNETGIEIVRDVIVVVLFTILHRRLVHVLPRRTGVLEAEWLLLGGNILLDAALQPKLADV